MSKTKTGCVIVIMGRQGSGKTPTVKEIADKSGFKNKIVYDPRYEYDENVYTTFHSFSTFKKYIIGVKNSFIIIEEATSFINSFKDMDLTEFVISVEHNKNVIVFLFHSIVDAPQYLLRLCRYMVLLQTNDDSEIVKRSRPSVYKHLGRKRPAYINNYK